MIEDIKVGEKIKKLREEKSISLETLSGKIGISPAELAEIEDQMISPSLGMLINLSQALKVPMGLLFDEDPEEPFCLVRANERKSVSRFASVDGLSYGYSYESLGSAKNRKMEPFLVTLSPPEALEIGPNRHAGEEFIFVLEGQVEVELEGHKEVLSPGDSIYYDSNLPHVVSSYGDGEAKILAVISSEEEMIIF